jgi:hypothetical protein
MLSLRAELTFRLFFELIDNSDFQEIIFDQKGLIHMFSIKIEVLPTLSPFVMLFRV